MRYLEIFVLSATAFSALQVYVTSRKVDEVNVSIKIRELINSDVCEDVYRRINKGEDFSDSSEEYDLDIYLGTLEELCLLYEHDVISKEQMNRQFGYRLTSIAKNKGVMKKLTICEQKYWEGLVKLIQEFAPYEYKKTIQELNIANEE